MAASGSAFAHATSGGTLPPDPAHIVETVRRPDHPMWWRALLPAGVLAVLGGLLVAERQDLWYDELYTAEVGSAPFGELARAVWRSEGTTSYLRDIPPSYNAPYYFFIRSALSLGVPANDVGLRLLSLIAAVAAVAVLVTVVHRLAGPHAALASGLLMATNPLVVEYSAEARMYGLAMLATTAAALALMRWLDGERHGLLLYGLAVAAAGLAHWFTLPVVAGFVVAALVLCRRRALPLLAVTAVAALPTLALMALTVVNGLGASAVGWIREGALPLPVAALQAWSGRNVALLVALLVVAAIGLARTPPTARVVAASWVAVPLLLLWLADAVRPLFVPRYLLPALLGVAVLAGLGAAATRWRSAVTAVLVGLSLVAGLPLLDRGPREPARVAVEALADVHDGAQPVVAVDRRAALALTHYAPPELRDDVLVPPADPPAGADVVWLLRQSSGAQVFASDDDEILREQGKRVTQQWLFEGSSSDLLLQRWE